MTIRPTRPLTSEAELRKLHDKLEWARKTFRPENGFLLDTRVERLPKPQRTGKNT